MHESTRSIPHPSSQPTARGRRLLRLSVLPLTAALCLPAALAAPAFAQSLPSATGTAAHEDGAGQDDIVVTEDNVDSWWHTIIGFLTGDDQDRDQDRGQDHDEERDQGQEQSEEGAATDGAPAGAEVEEDDNPASTSPWNDPNPFAGAAPYADPTYTSAERAESLRQSDPDAAAALDRITDGGVSLWIGDWISTDTVAQRVRDYVQAAEAAGRTPVITTYAAPARDCGSYSAGGLTAAQYGAWTEEVAAGLEGTAAAVIVEPDAIAQLGACDGQGDRLALLRESVEVLTAAGAAVYLDAGNSSWSGGQVDVMAERLREAGVEQARGFATNVSNFNTTAAEKQYAEELSDELGGAHYVIDTSRNGAGGNGQWCNPTGRELGATPGAVDDDSHQDANLWVKRVGESDGTCNGGPAAGTFWTDYAIALAQ